jgi:hypothetical protein
MRSEERRLLVFIWLMAIFAVAFIYVALISKSQARDLGQWQNSALAEWYRSLKQPDNNVSCCGEAESYYCDEHARKDQVYCIISDERDNEVLHRTPVPIGTEIDIPPEKINRDQNLEGRAIVFLSSGGRVYCFIGAGGV